MTTWPQRILSTEAGQNRDGLVSKISRPDTSTTMNAGASFESIGRFEGSQARGRNAASGFRCSGIKSPAALWRNAARHRISRERQNGIDRVDHAFATNAERRGGRHSARDHAVGAACRPRNDGSGSADGHSRR